MKIKIEISKDDVTMLEEFKSMNYAAFGRDTANHPFISRFVLRVLAAIEKGKT